MHSMERRASLQDMHRVVEAADDVFYRPTPKVSVSPVCGHLHIKASPTATKVMHVQFVDTTDELQINMVQFTEGRMQTFKLYCLSFKNLVTGWLWSNPGMFVLATEHNDRLYDEIYCYPLDLSRNTWLKFFERKGMRSMPFFDSDRRLSFSSSRAMSIASVEHTRLAIMPLCEAKESSSSEEMLR